MSTPFADDIAAISRIDAVPKILEVICRTTGLGFSAVARVTDSHWVACAVRDEINFGLTPGGQLELQTTICDEIRQSGQLVAIDEVATDPTFCKHHTPAKYGFQSYISVPIHLSTGQFFGTLCAIDPKPARVNNPQTIGMFKLFADLIALHLDAQDRIAASHAALLTERETAQLREQFIAILGHDLRNPLAAIQSATDYLRILPHDPDAAETLDMIHRSTARMAGLIDNLMDFARGRLGGGLSLSRSNSTSLPSALDHAITELQSAWPTRTIHRHISLTHPVSCDPARIAQMLSNLLANALTHGDPSTPISIHAHTTTNSFELSVSNQGPPIPPHILEKLFLPFSRGSARPGQQGLGLGLFISTEIARAHQGSLSVSSTPSETRFTFQMPLLN